MEYGVAARRFKKTGAFVLQPKGTFKGHGAYHDIYPCRELPSEVSAEDLGKAVQDLLDRSGPTGVTYKEEAAYRKQAGDKESRRIERQYFSETKGTASFYRKMLDARVWMTTGQKSYRIEVYQKDPQGPGGKGELRERVKLAHGPEALGQALLRALDLRADEPRRRPSRSKSSRRSSSKRRPVASTRSRSTRR